MQNWAMPTARAEQERLALYQRAAGELLRALRGKRSQVLFARRLGYRSNPITDWEHGRRHPTAAEALRAAQLSGAPVRLAFTRFHAAAVPRQSQGSWELARWMEAVRGTTPISEIGQRMGCSRFTVSRWLAGKTQPKLHEFLHFVDVLTGRVHEWVAELVPIAQVPTLQAEYERAQTAKTLAFEMPWTEAILRVLETEAYRQAPLLSHQTLSAWLGIPVEALEAAIAGLARASVIKSLDHRYVPAEALSVDTRSSPHGLKQLQCHWLEVARSRVARGEPDWTAYNVMAVSVADLERIQEQLKQVYRGIRSLVSASEPSEAAAFLVLHLGRFQQPALASAAITPSKGNPRPQR